MFKGISKIVQRISTFSTIQQVCFKFDMVFPSPEELGLKKNSNFKKSAPLWNSKIVSFFFATMTTTIAKILPTFLKMLTTISKTFSIFEKLRFLNIGIRPMGSWIFTTIFHSVYVYKFCFSLKFKSYFTQSRNSFRHISEAFPIFPKQQYKHRKIWPLSKQSPKPLK